MQRTSLNKLVGGFVGAAVLSAGLLSFVPVSAQDQSQNQAPPADGRFGGPRRGGPGGPGGPGGRGGRFGGPMGFGLNPADLTDAQKDQIKAIHDRHAANIQPLMQAADAARKALQDNVLAGGNNLRALSIDLGKAEGDLALANAEIQTEVLTVLTAEQRQKIQERQKNMEARRQEMESRRGRGRTQ